MTAGIGAQLGTGDPQEVLSHYMAIYDSYHNHKELMMYAVTAFYVGGAAALFVGNPFWRDYGLLEFSLLIIFILVLGAIAFEFVRHQLNLRRSAGHMYKACSRLSSKWLVTAPDHKDLETADVKLDEHLFKDFILPRALVSELSAVKAQSPSGWWARNLTYMAMASSALLVLTRVFLTWSGSGF